MAVKLEGLSPKELESLITAAKAQMDTAREEQIRAVRTKIDALLANAGLEIGEVYAGMTRSRKKAAKRAGAGVPKYRNPADPSQTWTGFGKKPAWFVSALKQRGVTSDSLRIGKPEVARKTAKKATGKRVTRRSVKQ